MPVTVALLLCLALGWTAGRAIAEIVRLLRK